MKKVTKYFVEFFSPGSFFAESWTLPVNSKNPYDVKWDKNAYMFRLSEREDVIDGDKVYQGKSIAIGGSYYHPDSRVENLEQVKRNPKSTDILIRNMEGNGWKALVWSRWGNYPQHFAKGDVVLEQRG